MTAAQRTALQRTAAYDQIDAYLAASDLPRKEAKRNGLLAARYRKVPLTLASDEDGAVILLDGIAIDPSELEDGHWL